MTRAASRNFRTQETAEVNELDLSSQEKTRKDPAFRTASEVGDFMLEVTSRALMGGDDATFLDRFALPLTIGTYEGEQVIESRGALLKVLRGVQDFLRRNNIDLIDRRTVDAEFLSPDKVLATHESRYLCKGQQIGEVKLCCGTIERFDGFWMITSNDYAVSDAPSLNRALLGRADIKQSPTDGDHTDMKIKEA
ncbi:MAG: hypothetical protein AAF744_14025 [Pseudomonadota bacterium]